MSSPRIRFGWVVGFSLLATTALAGWEIEQVNYSLRPDGEPVTKVNNTLRVSKGRVRSTEGQTAVVIDYNDNQLTLMLPQKKIYWKGTPEDYLREIVALDPQRRVDPAQNRHQKEVAVEIKELPEPEQIAGRSVKRYDIFMEGQPFQQIWVAPDLDLSKDLDMVKLNRFQEKMSQGIRGSDALKYAALTRHSEYIGLYRSGFPMRMNSFLGKATMGREVVRISPADIEDSEFAAPAEYSRTSLVNFIDAQDALAGSSGS